MSLELFTNALAFRRPTAACCNRAPPIFADRRRAFAEETAAAVSDVAAIGELDYRLRHGMQNSR